MAATAPVSPLVTLLPTILLVNLGMVTFAWAEQPAADVASLSIDFAQAAQPISHVASGVLLALSGSEPPDGLVVPLHLTTFRAWDIAAHPFTPALLKRVQALGITHLQLILFNSWSDQHPKQWPGDDGDWAPWERFLDSFMKNRQERYPGCELDVWNEADGHEFWGRDRARFLEAWRRGVLRIRTLDPRAVIVGPSLSVGIQPIYGAYMEEFLLFAAKNRVLPDVLSWHELNAPDGRALPKHLADTRAFLKQHDIPITRISINEIVPQSHLDSPGTTVSYFANLEPGGVESAAKTCWGDDRTGATKDWNGKPAYLDGLLTIDTHAPRSTWWVYKAYADLGGHFVPLTNDPHWRIDGFAGNDPTTGRASILVGSCEEAASCSLHLTLLNLDRIPDTGRALVARVYLIPYSGHDALSAPEPVSTTTLASGQRSAEIVIPQLTAKSACEIVLTRQ